METPPPPPDEMQAASPKQKWRTLGVKKKIVLLGDPAVGKTSLITKFVLDVFNERYISTIGTKVTKKSIKVEVPEKELTAELTFMIWDVLGQMEMADLHQLYLQGAEGALIVSDCTRKETAEHVTDWSKLFVSSCGKCPQIVLVNKMDLKGALADAQFIKPYAEKIGAPHLFTSAKTGLNVENAFIFLGKKLVRSSFGLPNN